MTKMWQIYVVTILRGLLEQVFLDNPLISSEYSASLR